MSYGSFDRMPVVHWGSWSETRQRWIGEGMPPDADERQFFNATAHWGFVRINVNLFPAFEEQTIEETAEYRVFRDGEGVVQKAWKSQSCIPHFIDFTLKEAGDWEPYKKRLQKDPGRIPADLDAQIAAAEESGLALAVETGSMMGWIRNWMGVENMSYLMYDAPDVYADMVNTIADLTCWGIDQILPRMKRPPEMGFGWEDVCGKSGPLVSPEIFERCVAAGYRKIRAKLESYGVKLLGIDCDGLVEPLLPNWLEAGVNVFFPIEIGTWNADPYALRRKFGRELRILGGFNKLVLEHGRPAIDAEIERRLPLVKEGGLLLMPDHLITPGVPLADYQYYLDRIRSLRF
jgi:uroporphyrinogen decarboxylase